MEELKYKRKLLRSNITRILNFCNNSNTTCEQILARNENIDKYFQEFEDIQGQIESLALTPELQLENDQYRIQVEENYYNAKAIINRHLQTTIPTFNTNETASNNDQTNQITTVIETLARNQSAMGTLLERLSANSSTPVPRAASETANVQTSLQLPRITLPQFNGDYSNWIHFRDLFQALVHERTNLSNIEKFEYLKAHIIGDALSIIKHLKPSNENYTVAWELINKKYDNSAQIKRTYLKLLLDQPSMKGPNVSDLKRLLNNTNESLNALKAMNEQVEHWDSILLFSLERKLDGESQALWCRNAADQPTMKSFMEFMERRLHELENFQPNKSTISQQPFKFRQQTNIHAATMKACPLCKQTHFLFSCSNFKNLNINERIKLVRDNNICYNCLQTDHMASNCKRSNCKKCNKKHNTLLHRDEIYNRNGGHEVSTEVNKVNINSVYTSNNDKLTILPTAIVMILGSDNMYYPCRVLLDTGAQTTLISEACVQRLKLKRKYDKTLLCGVGAENKNYTRGKVDIIIKSYTCNRTITTTALCLQRLTQLQPAMEANGGEIEYFRTLSLADPYCNKPNQIDVIIGANLFSEYCLNGQVVHPSGELLALNTIFGWVIIGNVHVENQTHITIAHTSIDLSEQMQKFWEVEELQEAKEWLSEEEQQAENHYKQNVSRDETGRYIVRLPLKSGAPEFGNTYNQAVKRMYNMETKFKNNIDLRNSYSNFMSEYLNLNHMEPIPQTISAKYILPHHAVIKMDSTTTKLRVVFDGSAKGSNGKSLNQELLVGPKLQEDIFDLLVRFRKYQIGVSSDIEKMYRQILVHPEDRAYQCVVWRADVNSELSLYQLNTITYGTSAAPFLAVRTLKQIALDNMQQNAALANTIMQCFYVDDFMDSIENVNDAIKMKNELCNILSNAGLHLRKWSSNSETFLETVDTKDKEVSEETIIDDTRTVKTLGLYWNTTSDVFKYTVKLPNLQSAVTKRIVLSIISKVFDPLGWIAPVIVTCKVFMQKLWLKGIEWDSPLPPELKEQWSQIYQNINSVHIIQVPRWLHYSNGCHVELHGFADSSELAYAAAVYLRVIYDNGEIITGLIAAKTRVAPVKQITLPRLELCACQLLVRLIVKVKQAIKIDNMPIHAWTDSTIVLSWLAEHPRKWKSFVANRTSYIINILPADCWHHISSQENPADLATRGLMPEKLDSSNLWWFGPSILKDKEYIQNLPQKTRSTNLEIRKRTICHIGTHQQQDIFHGYSDFYKLIRITALLLRFKNNCTCNKNNKQFGFITTLELQQAHDTLIRKSQQLSYAKEIHILLKKEQLPSNHHLTTLNPFVDECGLLRVGGRLSNANISYNQKHPLILHKNDTLTEKIVRYYHLKYLHAGSRQLHYLLGVKYCISSITYVIKRCVYKCLTCMRHRNKPYEQQMGSLPKYRLETVTAFHNTGVDFAGPMTVRSWKGRGSKNYKCWIAVFVCLATKAMHLEAVTELTTDAFIATLRRFVARRGKPAHIFSDNGTNFVGCNNKLNDLIEFLHTKNAQGIISKRTSEMGIQWHFSPPYGPNFGGIWEAGVKSVKYHLYRVLGNSSVTYEEMNTILCQIESCLNSRPLTAKFEGDADPLTPAHFLIFKSMETVPDQDVTTIKMNRLTRWQHLQQIVQLFWQKWSVDYLSQLQGRSKWKMKKENLKLNDLVFVKDEATPPCKWLKGKIIQVHPGKDGLVRVVTVRTQNGSYKRPISKLCPLVVDI